MGFRAFMRLLRMLPSESRFVRRLVHRDKLDQTANDEMYDLLTSGDFANWKGQIAQAGAY